MIGQDLRAVREACGVTMGDLADAARLHPTAVLHAEGLDADVSEHFAEVYVAALAAIVRARTPVAVIDAPQGGGR